MCFPMSHITIKKWYSHVKTSIIGAITYYGEISLRMSKIIFPTWVEAAFGRSINHEDSKTKKHNLWDCAFLLLVRI